MKLYSTLVTLVAVAAAVPTSAKTCPRVPQLATFDDLEGTPGLPINNIPNEYKGLRYEGIDFTETVQDSELQKFLALLPFTLPSIELPGILPHSEPNYARIGLTSKLGGTPALTVNYQESNTESFRLESFYYGCAIQGTGVFALPAECMINFTGYKGNDNAGASGSPVCSQTYTYHPSTKLGLQEQAFGKFEDCRGKDLQYVTITAVSPGGAAALDPLLVLLLDDVKYSTKAKTC